MFNSLRGIISFKGESQLFLLAGGIEWISVYLLPHGRSFLSLAMRPVFIFFYHKEDQMKHLRLCN
jgi:hypothetical protein